MRVYFQFFPNKEISQGKNQKLAMKTLLHEML